MKVLCYFNRIKEKIKKWYRKNVFKEMILCPHNNFTLVGDVVVINKNIQLGQNVTIYPGVMFWGDGKIEIGDNVDIGKDTIIYASRLGGVSIGSNTMIAAQCYIIDMDHGIKKGKMICQQDNITGKITIGNDCWLGANVTVLRGSEICDGAVVGAKSLVKGKIESNSVVAGIPCKSIKMRL